MSLTLPDASTLLAVSLPGYSFIKTTGALFIGAILSAFLAGTMALQMYIYRKMAHNDHRIFRAVIYFLWVLDLVHTAFFSYGAYYYASKLYNIPALTKPIWSFSLDMALGALTDFIITLIYVGCIWRLRNRGCFTIGFTVVSTTLSMVGMGTSLGVMATTLKTSSYLEWYNRYKWLWYLAFGCRSAVDLIVALTTIVVLGNYKTRFSRTNKIIRFIILYCINTGILTITAAVLSMIMFSVFPISFVALVPSSLLPKFMLNALLSFLNSRQITKDKYLNNDVLTIPLTTLHPTGRVAAPRQNDEGKNGLPDSLNAYPRQAICRDQAGKGIHFVHV